MENIIELVVVEEAEEIAKVVDLFRDALSNGQSMSTNLGYHGGSVDTTVIWHEKLKIWSCFYPLWRVNPDADGCIFGINEPNLRSNDITVEINYDPINSRKNLSGRFLKSGKQYFIGHSGKLGGGKKGIGKEAFLDFYNVGNLVPAVWNNQTHEDVIVIGSLSDPTFPLKMATFVHQVAAFKGKMPTMGPKNEDVSINTGIPKFTPEYHGVKKYTIPENTIIAKTDHALVVSSLMEELKKLGYSAANDKINSPARDLYIPSRNNEAKVLFEVKTDLSTTSLYTGIGQLMFYGAWQDQIPRRILVIPDSPSEKVTKILASLKIEILQYDMDDQGVTFSQLDHLIPKNNN